MFLAYFSVSEYAKAGFCFTLTFGFLGFYLYSLYEVQKVYLLLWNNVQRQAKHFVSFDYIQLSLMPAITNAFC